MVETDMVTSAKADTKRLVKLKMLDERKPVAGWKKPGAEWKEAGSRIRAKGRRICREMPENARRGAKLGEKRKIKMDRIEGEISI